MVEGGLHVRSRRHIRDRIGVSRLGAALLDDAWFCAGVATALRRQASADIVTMTLAPASAFAIATAAATPPQALTMATFPVSLKLSIVIVSAELWVDFLCGSVVRCLRLNESAQFSPMACGALVLEEELSGGPMKVDQRKPVMPPHPQFGIDPRPHRSPMRRCRPDARLSRAFLQVGAHASSLWTSDPGGFR